LQLFSIELVVWIGQQTLDELVKDVFSLGFISREEVDEEIGYRFTVLSVGTMTTPLRIEMMQVNDFAEYQIHNSFDFVVWQWLKT